MLYLKSKDSQVTNGTDDTGAMFVPHPPLAEEPLIVRQEVTSKYVSTAGSVARAHASPRSPRLTTPRARGYTSRVYGSARVRTRANATPYFFPHGMHHPRHALPHVPQAESESFKKRNKLDLALHALAGAELDRRWAANRAELDKQLARFKAMRKEAEGLCQGATQECYWNDNGCGYLCLDRIAPPSAAGGPGGAGAGPSR